MTLSCIFVSLLYVLVSLVPVTAEQFLAEIVVIFTALIYCRAWGGGRA